MAGQNGSFFGSIHHPAGNIAEALVSGGYAKVADWTITHVTGGPAVLREAERKAQASRLRLWQDHVEKAKGQDHEFDATVSSAEPMRRSDGNMCLRSSRLFSPTTCLHYVIALGCKSHDR